MFYSEAILSKKGPLAKVWLAAQWERKLSKTQFLQTNINSSIGAIVGRDQAPMALRLSGQLLLGVVRIYSRKARYLLEDCNEAMVKIKLSFRPGMIDMPNEHITASFNSITLPEVISELDILMPDPELNFRTWNNDDHVPPPSQTISRVQDITLPESQLSRRLSRLQTPADDIFSVIDPETGRALESDLGFDMDFGNDNTLSTPSGTGRSMGGMTSPPEVEVGRHAIPEETFVPESFGIESETPKRDISQVLEKDSLAHTGDNEPLAFEEMELDLGFNDTTAEFERTPAVERDLSLAPTPLDAENSNIMFDLPDLDAAQIENEADRSEEAENIAPAPENIDTQRTLASQTRKRKLIVDNTTQITQRFIKNSIADTTDITRELRFLEFSGRGEQGSTVNLEGYLSAKPQNVPDQFAVMFVPRPRKKRLTGRQIAISPVPEEVDVAEPITQTHDDEIIPDFAEPSLSEDLNENSVQFVPDVPDMPSMNSPEPLEFDASLNEPDLSSMEMTGDATIEPTESTEPVVDEVVGADAAEIPADEEAPATTDTVNKLAIYDHADDEDPSVAPAGLEGATDMHPLSRNAAKTVQLIQRELLASSDASGARSKDVSFDQMAVGSKRADAVKCFYEVLLLSTKNLIHLSQPSPYGSITIQPKERFFDPNVLSSAPAAVTST